MSAIGQNTWLQSITITLEIYESEIELETTQLRNVMYSWMNGAWIAPGFPFSRVEALQDWNVYYYMLLFIRISVRYNIPFGASLKLI